MTKKNLTHDKTSYTTLDITLFGQRNIEEEF